MRLCVLPSNKSVCGSLKYSRNNSFIGWNKMYKVLKKQCYILCVHPALINNIFWNCRKMLWNWIYHVTIINCYNERTDFQMLQWNEVWKASSLLNIKKYHNIVENWLFIRVPSFWTDQTALFVFYLLFIFRQHSIIANKLLQQLANKYYK